MAHEPLSCLFIQFAREPVVGAVKTRMIPHLSPEQACELHCELVLRTVDTLSAAGLGPVELAVTDNVEHALFARCRASGVAGIDRQRGADLGERMYNALVGGLARFDRVVLVGSDCPGIDGDYLVQAVSALDHADIVLGPAVDGGYVLIGATRIFPEVFAEVPWGSDSVFAQTLGRLRSLKLEWLELPALADIDRPEDLPAWLALRSSEGAGNRLRR